MNQKHLWFKNSQIVESAPQEKNLRLDNQYPNKVPKVLVMGLLNDTDKFRLCTDTGSLQRLCFMLRTTWSN